MSESEKNSSSRGEDGHRSPVEREAGLTGRVIISTVLLAITVPFIAILWAWAGTVVKTMGTGW